MKPKLEFLKEDDELGEGLVGFPRQFPAITRYRPLKCQFENGVAIADANGVTVHLQVEGNDEGETLRNNDPLANVHEARAFLLKVFVYCGTEITYKYLTQTHGFESE